MSGLLLAWIAYPLLLLAIAYGCGATVEWVAGVRLPLEVLLPCGTALAIGVLDLATLHTSTVHTAIPALIVLCVVGLVRRRPWPPRRPGAVAAAGTIVFAVYAAPIVLSGMATWAGYVKLDDTATWLALVDRTLSAGHTLSGLGLSTYRATLEAYLTNGYPVGSFLPLGIGHALLGEDIAWLTDPWMAFVAAMLALSLRRIAARALGERARAWQPTAIAALAAQPALLYGYYLWGGTKEMAGAMLVAAFAAALLPGLERSPTTAHPGGVDVRAKSAAPGSCGARGRPSARPWVRRLRALVPAAVVVWATLAALSTGGLVWLVPGGALALAVLAPRGRLRLPSLRALLAGAAAVALAAFLMLRPGGFVSRYRGELTGSHELGNLIGPLKLRQIVGIWPAGDFRLAPDAPVIADSMIALAVALAICALVLAVRRARRELVLYASCALVGALLVYWIASPWLAGKALASASPALLLAALAGCAWLADGHGTVRVALAALAAAAIATGVVWSNLLAYHDASLAPRAQYEELAEIGQRIAGQGPTLMTAYSPYGARHFLREAEAESASELRERLDPLVSGQPLGKGGTAAIDQFQLASVLAYRTIVLRRSPAAARPPYIYKLLLRDRYWEVWQRPRRPNASVLAQLPLGNPTEPGAVPSCRKIEALARRLGVTQLVAPPVTNPIVLGAGEGTHPAAWDAGAEHLTLSGPGRARLRVRVARAGRYALWLGGSFSAPVTLAVNGIPIATERYEIQEDAEYVPFGTVTLERGEYVLEVRYSGGDWRPGSGGPAATVGPLLLQPQTPTAPLLSVAPSAARSLCGRTLDWVEAIGPSSG